MLYIEIFTEKGTLKKLLLNAHHNLKIILTQLVQNVKVCKHKKYQIGCQKNS